MEFPAFYAVNVGRGDCFFLEIPVGQGVPAIVLVDGGEDFFDEGVKPLAVMREFAWPQIDLLILTHLHHDHIVGLLDIAKYANVAEAVLPYPAFAFKLGQAAYPKAKQTQELFGIYERLIGWLDKQGTILSYRPPYGKRTIWQFGGTALRHLDPIVGDELPGFQIIRQLAAVTPLPHEEQEKLLAQFDALSNAESSVWMVENANDSAEQWILLGGDVLLPNWRKIMERESLSPYGFKVSHHGMKDALSNEILERMHPKWMMITNRHDEFRIFGEWWSQLATSIGGSLCVTGEVPDTRYIRVELPGTLETFTGGGRV